MAFNRNEYAKEYYKVWRANNKDKIRQYNKDYVKKHPEKAKESKKRYNETHKEEIRKAHHNYYIKNKQKHLEDNKKWIKNNPKRFSELVQKSKRKRVQRLREQGISNAWNVVNYGAEPKYKEIVI